MLPGNDKQTPIIFAFLVMVSGTIAIQNNNPLDSIRPIKTSLQYMVPGNPEQVDARLWQDPFSAIAIHENKSSKTNPETESNRIFIHDIKPDQNITESNRIFIHDIKPDQNILDNFNNIKFFGIMVPGGPQVENAESRRRRRYAVLSALNIYGFSPHDSSHIGYWKFNIKSLDIPLKVPFEILEKKENKIIVLWLNDDYFGLDWEKKNGPLQKLLELDRHILCEKLEFNALPKQDIDPNSDSVSNPRFYYNLCDGEKPLFPIKINSTPQLPFKIIGPAGSTILLALIDEIKKVSSSEKKFINKIKIYSPNATAEECLLLEQPRGNTCSIDQHIQNKNLGVSFLRTTLTDKKIAKTMRSELELRDIYPDKGDGVIFISEWDTFYGRSFPNTFLKAFFPESKINNCKFSDNTSEAAKNSNINCFSYLRGIDGNLSEKPTDKKSTDKKSEGKVENDPKMVLNQGQMERAEGNNQFDYLVRSVERIRQSTKGEKNVKAIGVLGSDVYDKLLVLQAMRHQFPNAVFFTTDMDARFLHRDEYRWTRNLIIGSAFGLQLHPELQKHIPPFRDNYQTATFFATFLAMEDTIEGFRPNKSPPDYKKKTIQQNIDTILSSKIYEIGRTRAFELTPPFKPKKINFNLLFEDSNKFIEQIHSEKLDFTPSTKIIYMGAGVFFSFILLLRFTFPENSKKILKTIYLYTIKRKKYRPYAFIGSLVFILFVYCVWWDIFINEEGEPFAWLEGVSTWPTTIGRFIAGGISLLLLWRGWRFSKLLTAKFSRVYSPVSLFGESGRKTNVTTPPQNKLTMFWLDYRNRNSLKKRCKRVLILLFLFMIFGILLTNIFVLNEPYRGNLNFNINLVVLRFFAVPSFLALLFFVVDSFWLHIWFIKELSSKNFRWEKGTLEILLKSKVPVNWKKETLKILLKSKVPVNTEDIDFFKEWIDIKLIANQTQVVGKMIYYPYIVLFLLIFFRNPLFDNWNMTFGLGVIFFLSLIYPIVFAFQLRRCAERARLTAMNRLNIKHVVYLKSGKTNIILEKQFEFITDYIRNVREGAFGPFSEQPFFRGLLIPFSGYGGLVIYQFLTGAKF